MLLLHVLHALLIGCGCGTHLAFAYRLLLLFCLLLLFLLVRTIGVLFVRIITCVDDQRVIHHRAAALRNTIKSIHDFC